MAWIKSIEFDDNGTGKLQPTQVVAHIKVIRPSDADPIVQVDTRGSQDREMPEKQSQTLQLGRDSAFRLYTILKSTYGF